MGEKILSIQAEFPGVTDEKKAVIRRFFDQGLKAYRWWQDMRNHPKLPGDMFWRQMKRKYPLAYAYLHWRFDGNPEAIDWFNGLAGKLSFMDTCSRRSFKWQGDVFTYSSEVWSGAERINPAEYLAKHFGGKAVKVKENAEDWKPYRKLCKVV